MNPIRPPLIAPHLRPILDGAKGELAEVQAWEALIRQWVATEIGSRQFLPVQGLEIVAGNRLCLAPREGRRL